MNINLKLTLPIINEQGEEKDIKLDSNIFLTPYYATEEDIIPTFPMFEEEDLPILRKVIFNASLTVNRITSKVEEWKLLTNKELFALRRDYVICLSTNEFAKRLNSENIKAKSQSKTLGDFTVSTSQTNDNTVLNKIFSDSSKCVRELEKLLNDAEQDRIIPVDFVKGRYNLANIQANDRLWWLKDLGGGSRVIDGYASNKFWYKGNQYKAATLNRDSYANGMSVLDYYRRGNEE